MPALCPLGFDLSKGVPMREYHILVAGSSQVAKPVVQGLRDRSLLAWSERPERLFQDVASLDWADCLVILDDSPLLQVATDPALRRYGTPRVLLTSTPLDGDQRAWLLDRHDFDHVLNWPNSPAVVAAFVERCVNRQALPVRFRVGA
jgi:hypothetical protein